MVGTIEHTDNKISKTKLKQEMHNLQNLGKRLAALSYRERIKLKIPAKLEEAIQTYLKIKSNSAYRRQLQFIGRLMRELEEENIQTIWAYFSIQDGNHFAHSAYIKRLEQTREALINDNNVLTKYIDQNPTIESTYLRTLIRNYKKEQQSGKSIKSYQEIFTFLKATEPFEY